MHSRTLLQSIGCSLVAMLLTACALDPILPGMTREAVVARMGPPGRVVPLASGTRLQYSRQPAGQQAFMVDLDASDHVAQVRQVLVQQEFARITPGTWTRADVEREFGRPASVDRVANWPSDILTYRWYEVQDMFYWVYLDAANVVRRTEQGIEYHHDDMN
ncbi:MAG: hypothetical protein WAT63_08165 [Rhodoferax sp.]